MIEVVRNATTTDLFRHLFPFFIVILAFAGFTYYIYRSPKDKFQGNLKQILLGVGFAGALLTGVVGLLTNPSYYKVTDKYHTIVHVKESSMNVDIVDEAAKSRGLLFRVKDHGSQQVRKTLGITDADDDRVLLTWEDKGPHVISVKPKTINLKTDDYKVDAKVKEALQNIVDSMAGAFKDLSGQTADDSSNDSDSSDQGESTDDNSKDEPFVDDPEASSEPAA
jgi:hypothetical protein